MAPPREWRLRQRDPEAARDLAAATGLSQTLSQLLLNRGILDSVAARSFLAPRLQDMLDPASLRGLPEAVAVILAAVEAGAPIAVYGDYDVDGMTASSVLFRFFQMAGIAVRVFLPDRFRDGYGLNPDRVRDLVEAGAKVIITVDCGISAVGAVALARSLGTDVVIVDHHQLPRGPLPDATATINPHHPECRFPFKELCAAGLAFYLAVGLRAEMRRRGQFLERPEPDVRRLLDLVALGTVADLVPLRGLNRILVHQGLKGFGEGQAGLRALRAVALGQRGVTASGLAFQVAPRLNAAGRLSSPMKAFELLTTDDPTIAAAIAGEVSRENDDRKAIQTQMEEEALAQALQVLGDDAPGYVLWDPAWHTGVAGIVAARVVERFHRPAAVIAIVDGVGKGSLRSISGFNVLQGLERCSHLLLQFGGHAHAAGVTIDPKNLDAFRVAFAEAARELTPVESLTPTLTVDDEVGFGSITSELLEHLGHLGPFGSGNPEPAFVTRGVRIVQRRPAGTSGEHFRLVLGEGGLTLPGIVFRVGDKCPAQGDLVDIAYRPEFNDYQGYESLQLRVIDFRPC